MGVGQRGPPVRSATGRPQPNQALEPTPSSVRCAPASGRGSPRAFGFFLQTEGNLSRVNNLRYDARERIGEEVARCSRGGGRTG
jgi:hypothetical protein